MELDPKSIFWLCGSPCAGKTTISSILAQKNNWNVYHSDDWWEDHRERASLERHPHWYAYSRLSGDPLWLKDPQEHVTEAERAYEEEFELTLEDLVGLVRKDRKPVIFDGFVSPKKLRPFLPSISHAFYLVAEVQFQHRYYAQRPWIHDVLAKTSNPEKAWANWMMRDSIGARTLEAELTEGDIPWMLVDGSISLDETITRIAAHFRADSK